MRAHVIDLSHHNWDNGMNPDFNVALSDGCLGVIFKASQGSGYQDPTYQKTRALAENAGCLWGGYHFGTSAIVKDQVSNFIKAVGPLDGILPVLDFEKNEQSPSQTMSAAQVVEFADRFLNRTGRQLTLYCGPYVYEVAGNKPLTKLAGFRVWWARYSTSPSLHPTWHDYWLWQYTDGHNGPQPRKVAGIGYCDCNYFQGSDDQLKSQWTG
jgi:lysozyme